MTNTNTIYTAPMGSLLDLIDLAYAAGADPSVVPAAATKITNSKGEVYGLLTKVGERNILAFRGTMTPEEWLEDFRGVPQLTGPLAGVHVGFADIYESLFSSLDKALNTMFLGDHRIEITGHSLGGALAQLAANYYFCRNVVTFAGPRTGVAGWALQSVSQNWVRVANTHDIVPHLAPRPVFSHPGRLGTFQGSGNPFDAKHAHIMTTYRPGVLANPLLTLEAVS
jgi:predicted lipase